MHEISLRAEEIFQIGSFPVTNSLFLAVISAGLLILLSLIVRARIKMIPGKAQNFFEIIVEGVLDFMDSVLSSRAKSEKYFPLIATIFIFITVSNWLGLMPIVGPFAAGYARAPLLRAPAADLNFTLILAVISVFSVNFLGVLAIGFWKHFSKFFTFKSPILSFVGLLELVSEFVKIISFSFRLFGNIFAGEVLLLVVGSLVPYFIPLPFLALEVFVGFIQAFIFSLLTLVFIGMAVQEQH